MSAQDQLPGVILRVQDTALMGTFTGKKKRVKVTLEAEVNDEAVWNAAYAKLSEGLKVYTVDDFKTEMLNALREEHQKIEAELRQLRQQYDVAIEENRQMKAGLSVLNRQITG